jgi:two-component system, OmpR family, phosphate regulon sensor histidine kinase PhoR
MKKSIFLKIFSCFLLITLVMSVLILIFSFAAVKDYYIESTANHLKNLGIALKEQAAPFLENNDVRELDTLAKRLGGEISTRITIVAPNGTVLADSEENPKLMVNHGTRTEIAQAMEGNTGRFLRESETLKQQMLYIALPVKKDNRVLGVIRLSLFLKDINTMVNNARIRILEISSLIIALSLLISIVFARSLSRPIKELSAVSRRIADEDFSARVFLKSSDELRELADSFNTMAARMQKLFDELTRQKEELDSVISSLQEGILVLNREEEIVLTNKSLRKIIGSSLAEGKPYWECFRVPQFDELIKKTKDTKTNVSEEISFNNKTFLCSATFLAAKEEIAVIFHDITSIRDLEKIKTDFVSNISHELRTPLTAIKGFVETLQDQVVSEENRHYLDIVSRNTDRLINIINDLLFLSELEEKSIELEPTEVDLEILLESITRIFEQKLKEKSLSLHVDISAELPLIKADPFKLEQMFINLIDNAIKYTEKGNIKISMKENKGEIEIIIEDTGIGIASEHLSRIFERFYVVDKSRSKKLGGTGLGLSIVKHVVLLHNGFIDVKSALGSGTKFIIALPL